ASVESGTSRIRTARELRQSTIDMQTARTNPGLEAAVESDEQEQFALSIELDEDVVGARQQGRELARTLGFSGSQSLLVVTAISELARNIIRHAGAGEILLAAIQNGHRQGLRITALD